MQLKKLLFIFGNQNNNFATNTTNPIVFAIDRIVITEFVYLDLFCHTSLRSKNRYGYGFFLFQQFFFDGLLTFSCLLQRRFFLLFAFAPEFAVKSI